MVNSFLDDVDGEPPDLVRWLANGCQWNRGESRNFRIIKTNNGNIIRDPEAFLAYCL
jgi:hypothetical protein